MSFVYASPSSAAGGPWPTGGHWQQALLPFIQRPEAHPALVPWCSHDLVLLYDKFPKARVHLLLLPRWPRACSPADLTVDHLPTLQQMAAVVAQVATCVGQRPLQAGFHAVPSLPQLHLHIISTDFDSPALKTKHHVNSFVTPFFVSLASMVDSLTAHGTTAVARPALPALEALLHGDMRCPHCQQLQATVPAFKRHVPSCHA